MAKEIQNIVVQITEEQHLDEERFVVGYYEDGTFKSKIIKKLELEGGDLVAYNTFVALATTKMNEI